MSEPIRISESERIHPLEKGECCGHIIQPLRSELAQANVEIRRLTEHLEIKRKLIEFACADSAEDDTRIRSMALTCGVTQEQLDADPSIIGVVEMIVAKLGQELLDSREKQNVRYDIGVSHGKQGLKDRLATKDAEIKRLRVQIERIQGFICEWSNNMKEPSSKFKIGINDMLCICSEALKSEGGEG